MNRFHYALKIVLQEEGGYSDHLADYGGRTMKGVTQATYDAYLDAVGRPRRHVKNITDAEVDEIYFQYWAGAKCDRMPEPLDLLVFDCAINSGPKRAVKLLQRQLGVEQDGVFGEDTMRALHEDVVALGVYRVCDEYLQARKDWYLKIVGNDPSQKVFLTGWMNRLNHLENLV